MIFLQKMSTFASLTLSYTSKGELNYHSYLRIITKLDGCLDTLRELGARALTLSVERLVPQSVPPRSGLRVELGLFQIGLFLGLHLNLGVA